MCIKALASGDPYEVGNIMFYIWRNWGSERWSKFLNVVSKSVDCNFRGASVSFPNGLLIISVPHVCSCVYMYACVYAYVCMCLLIGVCVWRFWQACIYLHNSRQNWTCFPILRGPFVLWHWCFIYHLPFLSACSPWKAISLGRWIWTVLLG